MSDDTQHDDVMPASAGAQTGEDEWQRQMQAELAGLKAQLREVHQVRQELADQISEVVQSRPEDLTEQIETLQRLQEAHTDRIEDLRRQITREQQTLEKNPSGEGASQGARTDPPPPKPSRWL